MPTKELTCREQGKSHKPKRWTPPDVYHNRKIRPSTASTYSLAEPKGGQKGGPLRRDPLKEPGPVKVPLKRPAFSPLGTSVVAAGTYIEARSERHQAGTIYRADATIEAMVKRPASYSFGSRTKHTWNGEKRDSAGMPFKNTPGPGHYNPTEVRATMAEKGFTVAPRGAGMLFSDKTDGPGPAGYEPKRLAQWQGENIKENQPAYTLKPRSDRGVAWDYATMHRQQRVPGPGQYNPKRLSTTKTHRIGEKEPERTIDRMRPGPGHYEHSKHTRPHSTFVLTGRPTAQATQVGGYVEPTWFKSPSPAQYDVKHDSKGHPHEMHGGFNMRSRGGGSTFTFCATNRPLDYESHTSPGPAHYFQGAESGWGQLTGRSTTPARPYSAMANPHAGRGAVSMGIRSLAASPARRPHSVVG